MIKSTSKYAETTYYKDNICVLSDVMNSMRISGSILINEEYAPPWRIEVPNAERLQKILKLDSDVQAVAFHFVKRGYLEITPQVGLPFIIEAGEMAICFGGITHQLSQNSDQQAIPVESLLTGGHNPFKPDERNKARSTSILCGVFMMRNMALNPLATSLPAILHVSALPRKGHHNLSEILNWISTEAEQTTQCTFVIERLLELLYAEVLRAHLENSLLESGWLYGIKDPIVGRAISMIHSRPGDLWSVKRLAQVVAMSPSRFAARFTAALGDSPMAYVTKWRMNVAGRLLGESKLGVGEIAANVGYENVAAFTRTFKRHLGVPPAVWRSRQR